MYAIPANSASRQGSWTTLRPEPDKVSDLEQRKAHARLLGGRTEVCAPCTGREGSDDADPEALPLSPAVDR